MKPLIYTIIEYQSFGTEEIVKAWGEQEDKGIGERARKFFQALEDFQKSSEDNSKFLKHSSKTKLKAQNYVGIIQTKHGTLEILPKCFRGNTFIQDKKIPPEEKTKDQEEKAIKEKEEKKQKKQDQKSKIKKFFELNSFKEQLENEEIQSFTLIDTPQKSAQRFLIHCLSFFKQNLIKKSQISSIDTCNTPLLDVFMQMFCQELLEVCKKGIRHDYVAIEENRAYLKGKLLFSGQIRHNLVHKERFYTSSDEYIADIASNRLIKSTLELIHSKATSHTTLTLINQCLEIFEEIPSSGNTERDFLSCTSSRHFSYYNNILEWCKLFLKGNSFSAYSGESKAYALLFPMEKLFESYVTHMLKANNENKILTQGAGETHHLLHNDNGLKRCKLKPDIVIDKKIIADTKWKPLTSTDDVDQSDLYQVFAYAHYYKASEVWLIYPKLYTQGDEDLDSEMKEVVENIKDWNYHYKHELFEDRKIEVKILFAPLAFH